MVYKTILAIIGAATPDQFLKQAAELCHLSEAHLSVLVVVMAAPPPIGDYAATISDAWLEEQTEDRRKLEAKITSSRDVLSGLASGAEVEGLYCEAVWAHSRIARRAIYADLVLIGDADIIGRELRRQAIDSVLFDARRPVLLVPKAAPVTLMPRKIVLAWDSSPDAAAAAREALDLMRGTDMIDIVMIEPDADGVRQGEDPGTDIAAYLAHHGVKGMVDRIVADGRTIAEALQDRAAELSADLIVMGAYGHSRLRERIFGGVTQAMIEAATIPVLLVR
ncbi:universal stress protein [Rhizobium binae]|uniref:universal stress protein n=1 Tax=Rhizobium binae TaxID=1138190 RepID=UPI001C83605F|nr:universal stress protein [Rhizobium binae]MBX4938926.1 universal stress protein [Rhizobium binae]MBX4945450.1 universal stress protein [Rhizobium binae]MBX4980941.1 universal stress protein [Rhizobium binae]